MCFCTCSPLLQSDLVDYNQPQAQGAIVKCALLCLGLLQLPAATTAAAGAATTPSLGDQLLARLGGGLEVETWSLLPHGSGLGGSSILSATVLAALVRIHAASLCMQPFAAHCAQRAVLRHWPMCPLASACMCRLPLRASTTSCPPSRTWC